jgi:hypothetical protein
MRKGGFRQWGIGIRFEGVLLLVFLAPHSLQADLDAFKDQFEAAEKNPAESQTGAAAADDGSSDFVVFLLKVFGVIWFYNNTNLHYGAYPYSPGGYIQRASLEEDERAKVYWLSTSLSGFYLRA